MYGRGLTRPLLSGDSRVAPTFTSTQEIYTVLPTPHPRLPKDFAYLTFFPKFHIHRKTQ